MTSPLAEQVVDALRRTGGTVACAESLTGGLVCSALVDVPGASDVLLGGVVAYAPTVKASVLGVPAAVLDAHGTVHRSTAEHMARGVARLLGSTHAIATTGVAGPGPAEAQPAGTVLVAVSTAADVRVRVVQIDGDRSSVRAGAVEAALLLLLETLSG
ncbi:MAG: Nicotinamide-nucleotide amidase [uncultured Nocardioidaceae bacterium]|uniref:Nicotinamide-nucleotide amidase n=1 Tax=uncultured Nocardioidaceae bacterium TaxID=253824 RepID=A0A6J4L465_9ACTN|nr:MAG: Nicotinamide-nucleotide amidase [uncultured Nocardioidaceae bacterium]